ncbi:hypothetical protein GTQ48_06035 [Alteromonas genovensis]|uniref:Spondin domain-containing protein n=1 Tax=Alteromonas genovensis TaxID=471225 RepID=A0A6N9TF31_9ALTE|nr:spondin domain-containing protein [Alteromonas genovensis]NDW15082.1 hypothetical protein [Alteromonas genovensis]
MTNVFQDNTKHYKKAFVLLLPFLLVACDDDDTREVIVEVEVPAEIPPPVPVSYDVTVTNLTNAQPLSPPAVILHGDDTLWQIGDVASVELERIAEGGDATDFLNQGVASAGGTGPIPPGDSQTISVTINDVTDANLTIATMLVNSNDAFTGMSNWNLSSLEVGETYITSRPAYDSGTESNSESAATMPGPAANGEGFNAQRNDTGYISMHPGIVSGDDGLPQSALSSQHKFDNPVIRIHITRTE